MEEKFSSETFVAFQGTIGHYIPEDVTLILITFNLVSGFWRWPEPVKSFRKTHKDGPRFDGSFIKKLKYIKFETP